MQPEFVLGDAGDDMEQALLQSFERLITAHTGLLIREHDLAAFGKTLEARIKALRMTEPEQYYQLLEAGAAQGEAEWTQLIALLTNQESYFFRDTGQFALLRERILPDLIERNRKRRTLRLWSAGCSTGEEPYSLAMLVDQLLPQRDGWNILILGTDIKEAALGKAGRAVYSPWSFRLVEPALQQHYFREKQGYYELAPAIRNMVKFQQNNLFKDEFPNRAVGIYDMDLILCRNVFIYFEWSAVSVVLEKFTATLRDGGYLVAGHAELNAQDITRLQAVIFAGAVVYQRPETALPPSVAAAPGIAPPSGVAGAEMRGGQSATRAAGDLRSAAAPPLAGNAAQPTQIPQPSVERISRPANRSIQPETAKSAVEKRGEGVARDTLPGALDEAQALFRNRLYGNAAEKLELILRDEPRNYAALCLAAQANANLGRHEAAAGLCRRAIESDAFGPIPYGLLAHIAEEQGDSEEARNLLKKVIYLAPSYAPAFLELGALYEKEGDAPRAQKMRATAVELLQALAPKAIVEPYGLTAQEIIEQLG